MDNIGLSQSGQPVIPKTGTSETSHPEDVRLLHKSSPLSDGARRVFDVTVASAGLALLSPALLLIALSVKLYDRGEVFYRARRVGKDGHLFWLYKFRSMVPRADSQGGGITVAADSRVTSLGRWLRQYKLDELPQLINVVKGDMSFVGPRPEDPRYVAMYTLEQRKVLTVRPGITSPASLHYRNEESLLSGGNWEKLYLEKILPHKLAIELDYLPQHTMWNDIKIIFHTIMGTVA